MPPIWGEIFHLFKDIYYMPHFQSASMNNFYILTGKIESGKTTFISKWCQSKPDVAGIITITQNGKRVLLNLETGEERCFELGNFFAGAVQKIGRYTFDNDAFTWAEEIISKTDFSHVKCFIFDEAGILELEKKGFYMAIQILLNKIRNNNTDVIFVVRETLVDEIVKLFALPEAKIYTKDNFKY
jgi:nucleoside-triphosphatase THEP1